MIALLALVVSWLWRDKGGGAPAPGRRASPPNTNDAVRWARAAPIEVRIRGAADADFIGLCAQGEDRSHVAVCAFHGTTFQLLWRTKPLIGPEHFPQVTLGVVASRAVAIDGTGILHVYDLRDGAELHQKMVGERARYVCPPVESPNKLWILLADGKGLLLDPDSMQSHPADQPPSCLEWYCAHDERQIIGGPEVCHKLAEPPLVEGFSPLRVMVEGTLAVAEGHRSPGTTAPMLIGYSREGPGPATPSWQRAVSPAGPLDEGGSDLRSARLAGGRIITTYKDRARRGHIIMIDARSGNTLWNASSPRGDLTVTPSRAYLMLGDGLLVRDAATGRALGRVGEEEFDDLD